MPTFQNSAEITGLLASPKVFAPSHDWHAKLRVQRVSFTQVGEGAVTSTLTIGQLPKGAIRLDANQSVLYHSAFGAGCLLDLGWLAYEASDGSGEVVADPNGLVAIDDVASAGIIVAADWDGAGMALDKTIEFRSREGVTIVGTISGAVIPDAATLFGSLVYTCE